MRIREGNKEADIISAAVELFAETGYETVRMADIAKRAGIATGTLYLYFKNKEILLEQIITDLWGKLYTVVEKSSVDSPSLLVQSDRVIDGVLEIFEKDPAVGRIFVTFQNDSMKMAKAENALKFGSDTIEAAKVRGEIHESIDPMMFTHFFWGSIRSLIALWASNPTDYPIARVRSHLRSWISGTVESAKRGVE